MTVCVSARACMWQQAGVFLVLLVEEIEFSPPWHTTILKTRQGQQTPPCLHSFIPYTLLSFILIFFSSFLLSVSLALPCLVSCRLFPFIFLSWFLLSFFASFYTIVFFSSPSALRFHLCFLVFPFPFNLYFIWGWSLSLVPQLCLSYFLRLTFAFCRLSFLWGRVVRFPFPYLSGFTLP